MAEVKYSTTPHLLCVGGDDHYMRVPYLLALRDKGFAVSAAGTCSGDAFDDAGIPFERYSFERYLNPAFDIWTVFQLRKLVGKIQPDIVQCFDTKPNVLVPIAMRGFRETPLVRTINGLGWIYSSPSLLASTLRPVYETLQRMAMSTTSTTVFQNKDDMAYFAEMGITRDASTLWVPGSGVDVDGFARAVANGPSAQALRSELGLEGKRVIMTVTRLTRQKGIPALLEAAARIAKERDDVRFVLVGPRESEGRLAISQAELDAHKPYVVPIGRRSDVPSLLQIADVFAFPTEYREGVPRVLMEAALAGVPIVTTRVPGCSDLVEDGKSGFLVDENSPEQVAARVLELLDNPERSKAMALRVGELVRNNLTLPMIVDQYARLYDGLCGRHEMDFTEARHEVAGTSAA